MQNFLRISYKLCELKEFSLHKILKSLSGIQKPISSCSEIYSRNFPYMLYIQIPFQWAYHHSSSEEYSSKLSSTLHKRTISYAWLGLGQLGLSSSRPIALLIYSFRHLTLACLSPLPPCSPLPLFYSLSVIFAGVKIFISDKQMCEIW